MPLFSVVLIWVMLFVSIFLEVLSTPHNELLVKEIKMKYQQKLELANKYRKQASATTKKLENGDTIFFRISHDRGVDLTNMLIAIGALEERSGSPITQDEILVFTVKNVDCYIDRLSTLITDHTSYFRVEKKRSIVRVGD